MLEDIRRLLRRTRLCLCTRVAQGTTLALVPLGAALVGAAGPPRPVAVVFPAGTVLPIRFLHGLTGGRDRLGASVSSESSSCSAPPAPLTRIRRCSEARPSAAIASAASPDASPASISRRK